VEAPPLEDDAPLETLATALDRDLAALAARPADSAWKIGPATCATGALRKALAGVYETAAANASPQPLLERLRADFDFYRSRGREDGAFFTGYYEPVLDGRASRDGAFVYPLYRRPSDLLAIALGDFDPAFAGITLWGRVESGQLAPYPSRREIDGDGFLAGRALELAWVDDPVALFFLHVQGSGVLRLAGGRIMRVGFAGTNGRPYTSIGRVLLDGGALATPATAPAIRTWLREHPERQAEVLYRNERYVFFRETPEGPVGRLGATLTPGRSIAVDASLYPLGGLAYVDTDVPVVDDRGETTGSRRLRRLMLVQDTGGALTGPGRVDVFFGSGERAGLDAGSLSSRGDLVFLVPRACAR
jgi:membrane-bound lytic murein transglycosylase A